MVIAEIQFRSTNVSRPTSSQCGLNRLAAILLVVFSHWLSFKKKMTFDSNFSERITSHWLNQSRSTYLTPRGVTSPRGVKKWRKISAISHYVWSYSEQKITNETSRQILLSIMQSSTVITRLRQNSIIGWTLKSHTPFLALTGELWGVFYEDLHVAENWPAYNGRAM